MGGQVTLRGVRKAYGAVEIIKGIDLEVRDGEFMVFVGPSGCGKSTTLRMIAGLEEISAGDLFIDGRHANALAPAERGAAMVFQSYALYPHMTVAQNMGFALRMAGVGRAERDERVRRVAEVLRITPLLDRLPKDLSGGQRQRVAIGRAIVRKPQVFLFDEPLSNLDASLRVSMRIELLQLHRELGATMIYVTHDQVEAMTMADRIAVFNQGVIEQLGAPLALYERPATEFVATFLGAPRINLLDAPGPQAGLGLLAFWQQAAPALTAGAHRIGVRPEHLRPAFDGTGVPATVALLEHLGDTVLVHLRVAGVAELLCMKTGSDGPSWQPGQAVQVQPDVRRVLAFDAAGRLLPAV